MRIPTGQRPALLALAGIALLAVGFLVGTLLHPAGSGTTAAAPSTPSASSVDVGFAQDMVVHHRQAVQMANEEMSSTDPVVASLAFDIASTQQVQIGQMQGWLSLWQQPLLTTGGYMAWMADAPATDTGGMDMSTMAEDGSVAVMPGMASTAELTALRQATGQAKDVLFLQLMLRHHQGGTGMLTYAAQQAQEPAVRSFAGQVASSQQAEVVTMTQLLAARGAQPLPASS